MNVDDSTDVYKIAAVSTKVRYNDFWPNYSDRYMAIPLTEAQLAEINDDLYPLNTEVCLRVKPNTAPGFPERLMEQSDTQFSVGNLFILKVHDYEMIREDYNRTNVNQMQTRFWMMGFLLVNILLGIVGTFWFRTQHRRGELDFVSQSVPPAWDSGIVLIKKACCYWHWLLCLLQLFVII